VFLLEVFEILIPSFLDYLKFMPSPQLFDLIPNLIVQRDWNLVSKGSRMTEEFAAFLKEISRF
jgi:hypothetical protein